MFEEINEEESRSLTFIVPPKPKVLVVDMSLVTGMDTSGKTNIEGYRPPLSR